MTTWLIAALYLAGLLTIVLALIVWVLAHALRETRKSNAPAPGGPQQPRSAPKRSTYHQQGIN